ncbi:MAG: TIGR02147 family protein [Bdellovibrionaceae bacterium]|nr:TIGR02147 family protein [Pseudobdellovibrionaceae bacterium]
MDVYKNKAIPCIFEYDDYRQFLHDLYQFFKNQRRTFSYRYFAQRAGFSSPNFLKLVIEGKRNLSERSIEKFAVAFKLTKIETDFFNILVHFNQSSSEKEKNHWAKQLLDSKGFNKIHPLKQAEYSYYANWYYIPIRELISLKTFQEDPIWIAQQFRPELTVEQVKEALIHLEQLQMIQRNLTGNLQQKVKSITTGNEVHSNLIRQYHKAMIQKGADSIDLVSREMREVSSVCIPISADKREEIKKRIQEFRREIMAIAENDKDPESVYQMNIQWFPIIEKE